MKENRNIDNKNAFTLAEVLITLGIIGVVAALTIPMIISKYQQKAGIVGFKKQISVLNQATTKIVSDWGYTPECFRWAPGSSPYPAMDSCIGRDDKGACNLWGSSDGKPRPSDYSGKQNECGLLNIAFAKNLKIIKKCDRAYYDGCTPIYKGSDTLLKENDDTLTDNDILVATAGDYALRTENIKKAPAWVLSDGAIIILQGSTEWILDVNGKKGPNKWGYDIYRIALRSGTNKGLFWSYSVMPTEKGGITSQEAFLK